MRISASNMEEAIRKYETIKTREAEIKKIMENVSHETSDIKEEAEKYDTILESMKNEVPDFLKDGYKEEKNDL